MNEIKITARQFVDDGYVAKVAAHECEVLDKSGDHIIRYMAASKEGYVKLRWITQFNQVGWTEYIDTAELRVLTAAQPTPAADAPSAALPLPLTGGGEGEPDFYELWLSAGGSLAVVVSWLRGSKGDMDDLTAQDLYNMMANEYGYPTEEITTELVERDELRRLREQVAALTERETVFTRDLQTARDGLMPFYNMWTKWFDSDGSLAGSDEPASDFGEWFWREAESEDITKDYKGAFDAINKAELL